MTIIEGHFISLSQIFEDIILFITSIGDAIRELEREREMDLIEIRVATLQSKICIQAPRKSCLTDQWAAYVHF
jgi:hypothetical protein